MQSERTVIDMRLINADALMETINRHCYSVQHDMTSIEPGMTRIGILQAIQEQPTIEPERKKGRWIAVDDYFNRISGRCSACGWEAHMYEDDVVGMNYCPNCGAKMEAEKDG